MRYFYFKFSAAVRANVSTRSFISSPLWPRTQNQWIFLVDANSSSFCHRSWFLTGFFVDVRQLFFFQPGSHDCMPFLTYWLSVWISSSSCRRAAVNAQITAINSMRLFVVLRSPPLRSAVCVPSVATNPQPPGPGLPRQEPSVQIFSILYVSFL